MYDGILVGTDGSEKADEAVERALELSEANGATLYAITVVNTSRYGEPALSSTEMVLGELEDRGSKQLARISDMGADRSLDVVTKCVHGNPSEEILAYAEAIDADLIVIGSHGRTHPRATMGSTATRVLDGSDRQVLVV